MSYLKKLQSIGFSREEAELYLASLELGMAKTSDLARKVNFPRTSIYMHANNLIRKGYLKKSSREKVVYYIPVEPKIIFEEASEKLNNFSKIIPKLDKLLDFPNKKPKIEYFDTKQGLIKIYERMLKLDYKHIPYIIESAEAVKTIYDITGWEFVYEWHKKFLKRGIVTQGVADKRIIEIYRKIPDKIKNLLRQRKTTIKIVDDEEWPLHINIYLFYPGQVFFVIPQDKFVLTIDNRLIYTSMVSMFQALFEKGGKPGDFQILLD